MRAASWFHVAEVEPGVHLVSEPGHVNCWLIHGTERTILLDTGLGIADMASVATPLTDHEIELVNSHYHFDHVGGNAGFETRLIHEEGADLLTPVDGQILVAYVRAVKDALTAWESLIAADRKGFFLIGPDESVRGWPPTGFRLADWRIEPPPATGVLRDGEALDLGNRVLRVIHTPGHSPDHICLLDEQNGILFAQDQAYYGPQLLNLPDSDVEVYARSARRLADAVRGGLRSVYVAHCLRCSVPPWFLDEIASGIEAVLAGDVPLVESPDMFGDPAAVADFGHYSFVLPAAK